MNNSTVRLPSLDGWRAVSIIFVLGNHCTLSSGFPESLGPVFSWLFDGNLGVRFFFVISGFLITYLLVQEHMQTGRISLRKFYMRRALRILPVYSVFLLVMFLLQTFTTWHQPLISWIANLTFTSNFLPVSLTTVHLWMLAVEEQFYLLWPVILVFLSAKWNERTMFFILGTPLIVAPIWREISYRITYMEDSPAKIRHFFPPGSFLNYFDSLAVGCITAILLTRYEAQISEILNKLKWESIFLGLILVLGPFISRHYGIILVSLGSTFKQRDSQFFCCRAFYSHIYSSR